MKYLQKYVFFNFLNESNISDLNKAKMYPYYRPDYSFLYYRNQYLKIKDFFSDNPKIYLKDRESSLNEYLSLIKSDLSELLSRTPVLSYGSNSSPVQLIKKFSINQKTVIPIINVELLDFDTVYASSITSYGSHPATIQQSNGTRLKGTICFLDKQLLNMMHKTESIGISYDFVELNNNIKLNELDNKNIKLNQTLKTYISIKKCLNIDNNIVALSSIKNEGRKFVAMSQEEAMKYTMQLMEDSNIIDEENSEIVTDFDNVNKFIMSNINNKKLRIKRNKFLKERGLDYSFSYNVIN